MVFILLFNQRVNDMSISSQAKGNQFLLRPLALENIAMITRWYERMDDLIMFDRHTPLPTSAEAMEATWRESILSPEPRTSHWFTLANCNDELVGLAGLQEINYKNGDAVLAIFIDESARLNGIGIRAGALLLDIGFRQLRLTRVSTFVRADNQGSQRLTEGLGFQEEGCVRQGWFANGSHTDILVIGILADEWVKRRETLQGELSADTRVALGDGSSDLWSWPQISAHLNPAHGN